MARRVRQSGLKKIERLPLGLLIGKNKKVLKVLDKHGVVFCAGCYLTLFSSPRKAAAYHAVSDLDAFVADLKRVLSS